MSEKLHLMQQHQSSEEWQEGVRLENRLRKIEEDNKELKRQVYWIYVALAGVALLVIGSFAHR